MDNSLEFFDIYLRVAIGKDMKSMLFVYYKSLCCLWRMCIWSLCILLGTSGCSIAGHWRTSQSSLPHPWPIAEITLTKDGRYTATDPSLLNSETGLYQWNGSTLVFLPSDSPRATYGGRLNMDGTLLLTAPDQQGVSVRYERVGE